MRPRLNMLASNQLEELAHLEGRSPTNVLHRIIQAALHERHAKGTDVSLDLDLEKGAGRFVCLQIKPMQKAAIKAFAEREDRSVANAMRVLIRDGLRANGVTSLTCCGSLTPNQVCWRSPAPNLPA